MRFVHQVGPFDDGQVALVATDLEGFADTERFEGADLPAAFEALCERHWPKSDLIVEPILSNVAMTFGIESGAVDSPAQAAVLRCAMESCQRTRLAGLEHDCLEDVRVDSSLVAQFGRVAADFFHIRPWERLPDRAFSIFFDTDTKRECALIGLEELGLWFFDAPGNAAAVVTQRAQGELIDPSSSAGFGISGMRFYGPFIDSIERAFGVSGGVVPIPTCTSVLGNRRPVVRRELVELICGMRVVCEATKTSDFAAPFADLEIVVGDQTVSCVVAFVSANW